MRSAREREIQIRKEIERQSFLRNFSHICPWTDYYKGRKGKALITVDDDGNPVYHGE